MSELNPSFIQYPCSKTKSLFIYRSFVTFKENALVNNHEILNDHEIGNNDEIMDDRIIFDNHKTVKDRDKLFVHM